jgi:radical SAM protein with 4Fe4S-binding SPASM domain
MSKVNGQDVTDEYLAWFVKQLPIIFLNKRFSCGAIFHVLHIAASGRIYPCDQFTTDEKYCLGNIVDDIVRLRNNICYFRRDFADTQAKMMPDECEKCWGKRICGGVGCYAENLMATGNPFVFHHKVCENRLQWYELLMWLYAEMLEKRPQYLERIFEKDAKIKQNDSDIDPHRTLAINKELEKVIGG